MLIPCPACARHVRQSESQCPFCALALHAGPPRTAPRVDRLGRAALFAFATASSAVACGGATPASSAPDPNAPAPATAPTEAPAPTPAPVAVAPAEPAKSTPPGPPAQSPDDHGTMAAAYGGPPMPSSPGIAVAPAPAPEAGPNIEIADIAVNAGAIANAERVVVAMRAGFRNCYKRGLVSFPGAEGKITLTIRVGTAGQVLGVNAHPTDKVPPSMTSCITARAVAAEFDPPTGVKGPKAQVTVDLAVTLTKQ